MLNIFPLMFLSLFAHALLRVALGGALFYFGYRHMRRDLDTARRAFHNASISPIFWPFVVLELASGILLILGAYTQIAALGALALSGFMLFISPKSDAFPSPSFYLMALFASLSLFITGAGAFAFDLPL